MIRVLARPITHAVRALAVGGLEPRVAAGWGRSISAVLAIIKEG